MRPGRHFSIAAIACVVALMMGGGAQAKRAPRLAEREAITAALPAFLRNEPVGCVWLQMSVSRSGKYAMVTPTFLNAQRPPCARYASNGYWILRRAPSWKVVWNGSDLPKCALGIPRDLTPCLP